MQGHSASEFQSCIQSRSAIIPMSMLTPWHHSTLMNVQEKNEACDITLAWGPWGKKKDKLSYWSSSCWFATLIESTEINLSKTTLLCPNAGMLRVELRSTPVTCPLDPCSFHSLHDGRQHIFCSTQKGRTNQSLSITSPTKCEQKQLLSPSYKVVVKVQWKSKGWVVALDDFIENEGRCILGSWGYHTVGTQRKQRH